MKQLCKELYIQYHLDLSTRLRKTDLILDDRGHVVATLSLADNRVQAYLQRCKPAKECSLCLEAAKECITFNGYSFCQKCQKLLREGLK